MRKLNLEKLSYLPKVIQLLSQGERPIVRSAKVYALYGNLSEKDRTEHPATGVMSTGR